MNEKEVKTLIKSGHRAPITVFQRGKLYMIHVKVMLTGRLQ